MTATASADMIALNYSCADLAADAYDGVMAAAVAGASAKGYDPSAADTLGVVFPYCSTLGWGGLGYVGYDGYWINTGGGGYWYDAATIAHEIGHNYGANHASDRMVEYGNIYSVMGDAGLPEGQFLTVGKEVFDWVGEGQIAHAVAPADAALCVAASCAVGGGTFTLQATDTGTLDPNRFVALRIYTPVEDWYYYVEFRTLYSSLRTHALIYWTPVYKTSGTTGVYGYTQIVDARGATATLDDAGLNVSETVVLDLEQTAAVVTVNGVVGAGLLNVSVSFVQPGSGYHEAALGVDGTLALDGANRTIALDGESHAVVSLGTLDPTSLELRASCASSGPVTLYVHEQYPLHVVSYGADPSLGAVAAASIDSCSSDTAACDSFTLSTGYSWFDGKYDVVDYPDTTDDSDIYYHSAETYMYIYRLWSTYWCIGTTFGSSSPSAYVECDVLSFPEVVTSCDWTGYMASATADCVQPGDLSIDLTNLYAGGQAGGDVWDPFTSANYLVIAGSQPANVTLSATGTVESAVCGTNRYLDSAQCVSCPNGTVSPANSDSASSCVACGDDEYFWSPATQCVPCPNAGLYVAGGAISSDASVCARLCDTEALMTLTMLNNRSCEEITIDSPYSNIGGTCSLTSQSATTFDYECLSSGGDTTHFVCTGAYCALTTADKSGWYVYDSSCTASDIRTVTDDCDFTNANYLSSDPIACVSDGWNGNAFAVVDDGGVTVANGTLAQGSEGAVDVCLSAGTCYNLTIDASGTSLSHIAWEVAFCKATHATYAGGSEGTSFCVSIDCYAGGSTPSPPPPPTSPPTQFPYPAPTVSPTPVPTQLPVPAPTALPGDPTALPVPSPTLPPAAIPTLPPTPAPTMLPFPAPSSLPVLTPTPGPTSLPVLTPTLTFTTEPTPAPAHGPTTAPTLEPSPIPTSAPTSLPSVPPSPAPTPAPTPSPTRTPIVAATLGLSGIACNDFDADVYDNAMGSVVANATFSAAVCSDYAGDDAGVTVVNEITLPLAVIRRLYGHGTGNSAHSHVEALLVEAVSTGAFTTAIQQFARRRLASDESEGNSAGTPERRRLDMSSASADSVSVDTFAPSPAPTEIPTGAPTQTPSAAPSVAPVPSPTQTPTQIPSAGPTTAPLSAPSVAPLLSSPTPSAMPTASTGAGTLSMTPTTASILTTSPAPSVVDASESGSDGLNPMIIVAVAAVVILGGLGVAAWMCRSHAKDGAAAPSTRAEPATPLPLPEEKLPEAENVVVVDVDGKRTMTARHDTTVTRARMSL